MANVLTHLGHIRGFVHQSTLEANSRPGEPGRLFIVINGILMTILPQRPGGGEQLPRTNHSIRLRARRRSRARVHLSIGDQR